jgi:hypothetical protein
MNAQRGRRVGIVQPPSHIKRTRNGIETYSRVPYDFGIRPVMPKCKECGKFCGHGAKTFRSYDWQGVPIEDYVLCKECQHE